MGCEEIKWIAATDEHIAVLGGPQFNRFPERMRRVQENAISFLSGGRKLTVLDGKTLKAFWSQTRDKSPEALDARTP